MLSGECWATELPTVDSVVDMAARRIPHLGDLLDYARLTLACILRYLVS